MKKSFFIIFALGLAIFAQATIYNGECGYAINWSLNTTTGKLTLSGAGDMYTFTSKTDVPWHQYRTYIKTVVCDNEIYSIGNYAFINCTSLKTINIPSYCEKVGISAFESCTSLTSVTFTSECTTIDDYAFAGCSSLSLVNMAEGLKKIGEGAFFQCTHSNLSYMNLPQSLEEIGESAFAMCTGLKTVIIGNQIKELAPYTFQLCQNLTNLTLGDKIWQIGESCFDGCTNLQKINNAYSVEYIERDAFRACMFLESITFSDKLYSIAPCAFQNCISLSSIEMGNKVTDLSDSTFIGCSNLKTIKVAKNIPPYVGTDCFNQVPASAKVYVPSCTINCYRNDNGWSYFSNFYENNSSSVNCNGISDCQGGSILSGLTCQEAINIAKNLTNNTQSADMYSVYGYVTSITKKENKLNFYYVLSLYIGDTKNGNGQILVEDAMCFNTNEIPVVGDYVLVVGYIYRSGSTYKIVEGSVSKSTPPESTVSLPADGSVLTCSDAAYYASLLNHNKSTAETYTIYGYITETDGIVSRNQQIFWMADTQHGGKVFEIYWGNVSEQLQEGDYVKCQGHLMRFYETSEMKNPDVTLISRMQGFDDVETKNTHCTKILRNGQILIQKSDKTYSITGQEVK